MLIKAIILGFDGQVTPFALRAAAVFHVDNNCAAVWGDRRLFAKIEIIHFVAARSWHEEGIAIVFRRHNTLRRRRWRCQLILNIAVFIVCSERQTPPAWAILGHIIECGAARRAECSSSACGNPGFAHHCSC